MGDILARETPIDEMIECALEELLSGSKEQRRTLVRRMCLRWPSEPALSIIFSLTSAAAIIEDNLSQDSEDDSGGVADRAYRLAAVLAADIYAVECMHRKPPLARDLLHFWRRVDGYFSGL
ncbi:hypothetical protein [Aliiroseovarius sp.]|uniref:hypothetical protein n=1 Tax=Aliiroseovarius sp. TaxID=1872442 RepID=UPI003BA92202